MKTITGNLLDIKRGVVCHQVNCIGIKGGLAAQLFGKYPNCYNQYVQDCKERIIVPGACVGYFVDESQELILANFAGQYSPQTHTEYFMVECALYNLKLAHKKYYKDMDIYIPFKMGAGIGLVSWDVIRQLIKKHIPNAIIVQRPEDKSIVVNTTAA